MTTLAPASVAQWRAWLEEHATTAREVWLVLPRKGSGLPGLRYDEAVEQALCFGWIDSLARSRDEASSLLRFSPRRPTSRWSASNVERVRRLTEQGQMTPAGQALIDLAKARGTWPREADGAPWVDRSATGG